MKDKESRRLFRINEQIFAEVFWNQDTESWRTEIYVWGQDNSWAEYKGRHATSPLKSFKTARLKMRLDRDPEFKKVYERMVGNKEGYYTIKTGGLYELRSAILIGQTTVGELVAVQIGEKDDK